MADQDPKVTGQFYRAMARRMVPERVGVDYVFADLGKAHGYPERAARQLASKVRKKVGDSDGILLIFDAEASSPEAVERARCDTERFACCLADVLGIDAERVHVEIVVPTTEAAYLLDETMLAAAKRASRAKMGLHELVGRKRAGNPPPKTDMNRAVRNKDKKGMATAVAAAVRDASYEPPETPAFRRIRRWLSDTLGL